MTLPAPSTDDRQADARRPVVPPDAAPLAPLADLPGLTHARVIATDGRVHAEIGTDQGSADALLAWGLRAGAVAVERARTLDDLIITTDEAHHLVRCTDPTGTTWIQLRIDRARGNLALARRRLAGMVTTGPRALPPAPPPPDAETEGELPAPRPPLDTRSPRPWIAPARAGTAPRSTPTIAAATPTSRPQRWWPSRPRRTPTPTPPSPPPATDLPPVLAQRWRNDAPTLRRILAGLRRLSTEPRDPDT